ncbi:hypothetical protein F5887DRAFT_1073335 [Amanita rubescens]|nr:hypothetical protein F5887DRAFT_1073335 [Amanita rubescens]
MVHTDHIRRLEKVAEFELQPAMNPRVLYIKGYLKVDKDRLKAKYASREDDPEYTRFLGIWQKFPLPFKYLEVRWEPDGNTALVLVLEDDDDRECLEKTDILSLGEPYTQVFTPGDLGLCLRKQKCFVDNCRHG